MEGEGERFKDEIENGVHGLETLLEATVDKTFDRFEIFTLRNILTVPDDLAGWMRLTHYEVRGVLLVAYPEKARGIEALGRGFKPDKS